MHRRKRREVGRRQQMRGENAGVGQVLAQQRAEVVRRHPGQEGGRDAEAAEPDRHVEA
jgi:hypothetical protein